MKAGVATAALGMATPVVARHGGPANGSRVSGTGPAAAVDSPVGFGVEVLAGHASFPDAVSARFGVQYDGDDADGVVSDLPDDASSVVVAKVTWEPAGTTGWHTHPGPVIVNIAEGELAVRNASDCVVRQYVAGEAFIDPGQGNVHVATNPSESAETVAYATFLGVPDGQPATVWVEPVDC